MFFPNFFFIVYFCLSAGSGSRCSRCRLRIISYPRFKLTNQFMPDWSSDQRTPIPHHFFILTSNEFAIVYDLLFLTWLSMKQMLPTSIRSVLRLLSDWIHELVQIQLTMMIPKLARDPLFRPFSPLQLLRWRGLICFPLVTGRLVLVHTETPEAPEKISTSP